MILKNRNTFFLFAGILLTTALQIGCGVEKPGCRYEGELYRPGEALSPGPCACTCTASGSITCPLSVGTCKRGGEPPGPRTTRPYTCDDQGRCILQGDILGELRLTADKKWLLRGTVGVGNELGSGRLLIEPGTTVYGESKSRGTLVVRRGSQILAQGTRKAPIVFTSDRPEALRDRGDWGGLEIHGRAAGHRCLIGTPAPCRGAFGEQTRDDADNSGILRYVRIEYAGQAQPQTVLARRLYMAGASSALRLHGVGSKTTLEYLQVYRTLGRGIHILGGTARLKRVVVLKAQRSGIEWAEGWRGKAQFVVVLATDPYAHGVVGSNDLWGEIDGPRSNPSLSHITVASHPQLAKHGIGLVLSHATDAKIYNSRIFGFGMACLSLSDDVYQRAMDGQRASGTVVLSHTNVRCRKPLQSNAADRWRFVFQLNPKNEGSPLLTWQAATSWKLQLAGQRSPRIAAIPATSTTALADPFFTPAAYRGAIGPHHSWTRDWAR